MNGNPLTAGIRRSHPAVPPAMDHDHDLFELAAERVCLLAWTTEHGLSALLRIPGNWPANTGLWPYLALRSARRSITVDGLITDGFMVFSIELLRPARSAASMSKMICRAYPALCHSYSLRVQVRCTKWPSCLDSSHSYQTHTKLGAMFRSAADIPYTS